MENGPKHVIDGKYPAGCMSVLRGTPLGLGTTQGFVVGLASIGLSLRLGLTLILFYKSSSVLTKVGFDKKVKLTADYKARK